MDPLGSFFAWRDLQQHTRRIKKKRKARCSREKHHRPLVRRPSLLGAQRQEKVLQEWIISRPVSVSKWVSATKKMCLLASSDVFIYTLVYCGAGIECAFLHVYSFNEGSPSLEKAATIKRKGNESGISSLQMRPRPAVV